MDSKKATDEQLIAAYSETKSFRAVARQFGMNKKMVQTRLSRISS
jgi:transposase-like protein